MEKLRWMLALLAVVRISGQSPESVINLENPGPTPFRREPTLGPSPVFREPAPLDESSTFTGNSGTSTNNNSASSLSSQPLQPNNRLSETSSESGEETNSSKQGGGEVSAGARNNNNNIENTNSKKTIIPDPERPFILYPGENASQHSLSIATNENSNKGDSIRLQGPGVAGLNDGLKINDEIRNINVVNNGNGNSGLTTSLPRGLNQNSNGPSLGPPASGAENFKSVGSSLPNNIPSGNRLINSDSGKSLLDFEPGRSSLYVSVPRPLQVSSAPVCTFPQNFGQDQFELSTSEFGYPKSIVQQALKDSVAEAVLKTLTDIMFEGVMATQVPGYPRNRGFQGVSLINNGLQQNQGLFGSSNSIGSSKQAGDGGGSLSSSFESLGSSFDQKDFGVSDDNFRLTSRPGALGNSGLNEDRQSFQGRGSVNEKPQQNTVLRQNASSEAGPNSIQGQQNKTQGSGTTSEEERGVGNQSQGNAPGNSNTVPLNQPSSGTFNAGLSRVPTNDFGNFESFDNTNPFLQRPRGGRSLLRSGNRGSSGNTIDRLFPPKASDMFLDDPPSPVGGDSGNTPFISYNDGQRSRNVDSPFNFDSRSLFGSLPASPFRTSLSGRNGQGSSFGSSLTESSPQTSSFGTSLSGGSSATGVQRGLSGFGATGFGTASPLFDSGRNNGNKNSGSTQANQGFPNPQFGFSSAFTRKKRQASQSPDQIQVTATCSPTYKLLRQYKHYNGACFVVMPESQGVYFAECSNSPCSGCRFEGGASRCTAGRVPLWVWSYCEAGPNKGKVMPDRVEVSVTCSCKTTLCQSAVNGR